MSQNPPYTYDDNPLFDAACALAAAIPGAVVPGQGQPQDYFTANTTAWISGFIAAYQSQIQQVLGQIAFANQGQISDPSQVDTQLGVPPGTTEALLPPLQVVVPTPPDSPVPAV